MPDSKKSREEKQPAAETPPQRTSRPGPGDPKWERDNKVLTGEVKPGTGDITPIEEQNTAPPQR